jgi:hypothetical protein
MFGPLLIAGGGLGGWVGGGAGVGIGGDVGLGVGLQPSGTIPDTKPYNMHTLLTLSQIHKYINTQMHKCT